MTDEQQYNKHTGYKEINNNLHIAQKHGFLASLFSYKPFVVRADVSPEFEVLGVSGIGDCIGITAWHGASKTTFVYHMYQIDEDLPHGLIDFIVASNLASTAISQSLEDLKKGIIPTKISSGSDTSYDHNIMYDNINLQQALDLIKGHQLFKSVHFTLVTRNPKRNMQGLLAFFERIDVDKFDISMLVDSEQGGKLIISRDDGSVCTEFDTGLVETPYKERPLSAPSCLRGCVIS